MITDEALLRELADKDDWIGASKLAKTFGVTTRTLRSYVRRINGSSKSKVIDSSHSGYRLVCPPNSLLFSKQTTPHVFCPRGARRTRKPSVRPAIDTRAGRRHL